MEKSLKSSVFISQKLLKYVRYAIILSAFLFFTACPSKKNDSEWLDSMLTAVNLVDQGNGTVLDVGSGRTWMKCAQGQVWNGALNNCAGTGGGTTYGAQSMNSCGVNVDYGCVDALLQANSGAAFDSCSALSFAGFTDWRLPTKIELYSLKGLQNRDAMLIPFPQTPDDKSFWSGEQSTSDTKGAYGVNFATSTFGQLLSYNKNASLLYVRCIR